MYTYRGHGRHNTEIRETRKNTLSKPTSLPFGLKYRANACVCMSIQKEKKKNNGPKATLLFATVVVNMQAKSSRQHGVHLLF